MNDPVVENKPQITVEEDKTTSEPKPVSARAWLWIALVLFFIFGVGLTRDISEPWYGIQDWNGAFFSQLARNQLRYPWSVHHGMPVVAMGEAISRPSEASVYATHPPALVWLLAIFFSWFGDNEWAARLLPITFSLGSFWGLLWLVRLGWGAATSLVFGAIYAVLPMTVYFGRMVDHEAPCLACAVAVLVGYAKLCAANRVEGKSDGETPTASRATNTSALLLIVIALTLGIWIDWFGVLFGGLFCAYLLVSEIRHASMARPVILIAATAVVALVTMLTFLIYAGLDGRWADLWAIFTSRAGEREDIAGGRNAGAWWRYVVDNLTVPVLLAALIGMPRFFRGRTRGTCADATQALAARRGLYLVTVAGGLWLGIFWQQFLRHEYWMYYLGPAIALAAALALHALWLLGWRHRLRATQAAALLLLLTVVIYEIQGVGYLYRDPFPQQKADIADWQAIHELTDPADRVVYNENPYRTEERGGYRFRNIVPPQLAYYMDRRLTISSRVEDLADLATNHAAYVRLQDQYLRRPLPVAARRILSTLPTRPLNRRFLYELGD